MKTHTGMVFCGILKLLLLAGCGRTVPAQSQPTIVDMLDSNNAQPAYTKDDGTGDLRAVPERIFNSAVDIPVELNVFTEQDSYWIGDPVFLTSAGNQNEGGGNGDSEGQPIISQDPEDSGAINDISRRGRRVRYSGVLEVLSVDFKDGTYKEEYFLRTKSKSGEIDRKRVYFGEQANLISGSEISVVGKELGGEIVPDSYVVLSEGEIFSKIGEQRTLVLLVNVGSSVSKTPEQIGEMYFGENSVSDYFESASYGKTWLAGDVFGWYVPEEGELENACSSSKVLDYVSYVDQDDYNFSDYTHLVIVVNGDSCAISGAAYPGPILFDTNQGDVVMTYGIVHGIVNVYDGTGIHEFGHQLGLRHAQAYECGDEVIEDSCIVVNYGDVFDVMGKSVFFGHFNPIYKEKLGWFDDGQVLKTTEPGIYTLTPLETVGGLKALKIPSEGFDYYFSFRQPIGYDVHVEDYFGEGIQDGAMVHATNHGFLDESVLLDTTPGGSLSLSDFADGVLKEGKIFEDPYTGMKVKVEEVNEDSLVLRVIEPLGNSEIVNNCAYSVDGNLFVKVDYFQNGEWRVWSHLYDGELSVPAGESFALENLWFDEGFETYTPGDYRVYVEYEVNNIASTASSGDKAGV